MADWTSETGSWADIATKDRKKKRTVENVEDEPETRKKGTSKRDALNKIKAKRRYEECEEEEVEERDENPLKQTSNEVSDLAKTAVTGMVTIGTLGLMSEFMKRI